MSFRKFTLATCSCPTTPLVIQESETSTLDILFKKTEVVKENIFAK